MHRSYTFWPVPLAFLVANLLLVIARTLVVFNQRAARISEACQKALAV
jgi:hypothetical protein